MVIIRQNAIIVRNMVILRKNVITPKLMNVTVAIKRDIWLEIVLKETEKLTWNATNVMN